jgi:hypothetical protein
MGFLATAKRIAAQARTRLDARSPRRGDRAGHGAAPPSGRAHAARRVHGRPLADDPAPPHGDPLAAPSAPPAAGARPARPEPVDPASPHGDPLREAAAQPPQPPAAPGLSGGDPVAG